jgi:hypothetical protein
MDALDFFQRAERIRPAGNDDAILRWNASVRMQRQHPEMGAHADTREEPLFLE